MLQVPLQRRYLATWFEIRSSKGCGYQINNTDVSSIRYTTQQKQVYHTNLPEVMEILTGGPQKQVPSS